MKVIRCKDCVLASSIECPLTYIENQELRFIDHNQMFYCGKAKAKPDYEPTRGDIVRNMTDAQLADYISGYEMDAYDTGKRGGRILSSFSFWKRWFSTPPEEEGQI